jgi:hypothetical protein
LQIENCKLKIDVEERPALGAADLLRWAVGAGGGLLLVAAGVLGSRRLAGALTQPLQWASLLVVAVVLVTTAAALRLGRRALTTSHAPHAVDPLAAITSAAVVLVALSLSLPGTSWSTLAVFWLLVAAEEAWAWRHWWRGKPVDRSPPPLSEPSSQSEPGRVGPEPGRHAPARMNDAALDVENHVDEVEREEASEETEVAGVAADEPPAENVTQQLTRSQAADGSETLVGWLRIALAAGQRNTNVHVAFCPPFARTPQVTVEQLDGPETRIKVVQVLPYGVRCDLKLAGPSDVPANILLQLSAHAEPCPRPASPVRTSAGEVA